MADAPADAGADLLGHEDLFQVRAEEGRGRQRAMALDRRALCWLLASGAAPAVAREEKMNVVDACLRGRASGAPRRPRAGAGLPAPPRFGRPAAPCPPPTPPPILQIDAFNRAAAGRRGGPLGLLGGRKPAARTPVRANGGGGGTEWTLDDMLTFQTVQGREGEPERKGKSVRDRTPPPLLPAPRPPPLASRT